MKTLWCKNQENPSDRISHTWAPLNSSWPGILLPYGAFSRIMSRRSQENTKFHKYSRPGRVSAVISQYSKLVTRRALSDIFNCVSTDKHCLFARDGIFEHQFNKRLESFAPCYSQPFLLADF
jgi:hypothetical protein